MKSYKIYLTKSSEVAGLLQSHFAREMNNERDRKSTMKTACIIALWRGTAAVVVMRSFLHRRTNQWTQLIHT